MEHRDLTWRRPRSARRAGRTPAPRRAPLGHRVVAAVGFSLSVAVGATTVTTTLAEARDREPAWSASTVTPGPAGPATAPGAALLRLWGLRLTPQGTLAPAAQGDPVARTTLELYADLLAPPRR